MIQRSLYEDCKAQVRRQRPTLFLFSFACNMLLLVSSIYMLQVFDRVLSSGSMHTLLWLTLAAIMATVVYGLLEHARRRLLSRTGSWLDQQLSAPVIRRIIDSRLLGVRSEASLGDVNDVKTFLSGDAILAFLDAPWTPVFIAVIWIMHPVLGMLALGGAVLLFAIAVMNDMLTRRRQQTTAVGLRRNQTTAQQYMDNGETVRALGMLEPLMRRWQRQQAEVLGDARSATNITEGLTNITRATRLGLQILILGLGAWLVLGGQLTSGGMIAASIILSRALSPVERAMGAWRSYVSARTADRNLTSLFASVAGPQDRLRLPRPEGRLAVESLRFVPRGGGEPILKKIDFELAAGETCGIIGPSGSGKSTLCRLIVGAWQPTYGHVRLDNASVASWDPDELGRHIGYLPQTVELFPGTVAENIARMGEAEDSDVVAAARLADVHEMILRLPSGYDMDVGVHGNRLSGGQKQRIGLARALFGAPSVVVLDEPNSNLDSAGEQALLRALALLKERGCTVLIVAHQPNALRTADKILVIKDGAVAAFGARDDILRGLMARPVQSAVEQQSGKADPGLPAPGPAARTG